MTRLEKLYDDLYYKYSFECPLNSSCINRIIHSELINFLGDAVNPAIYCNGLHTKNLLSDFVFEMKKVRYIIDNYADVQDGGYNFIGHEDISKNNIDKIIISTYRYRKKVISDLKKDYPDIEYLDIYEKLAQNNIELYSEYYNGTHPYNNYHVLNKLQNSLEITNNKNEVLYQIVEKYIQIKDFMSAIKYCELLLKENPNTNIYKELLDDVTSIYELEKQYTEYINRNNVLMLCLDGLRYQDMNDKLMPKCSYILSDGWDSLSNTYSYSTSTYESLVPVYSENIDFKTKYYEHNFVDGKECRFIQKAYEEKRDIHFYTDGFHYIEQEDINYIDYPQTLTQKLWDFIIDAQKTDNGLFYIHGMYETHFTFSNPYTKESLISEGTAMLFDFLPLKGGKMRTDYVQQHDDALHYIDDVLAPLLRRMSCKIVLYADHGNLLMNVDSTINDIRKEYLQASQEWLRIPFYVKNGNPVPKQYNGLHSLLAINDVIISLLEGNNYEPQKREYIKIARSEMYNPDFKKLYKILGEDKRLQAFEGFIFSEGYKLIVYPDKSTELYDLSDNEIFDVDKKDYLFKRIASEITM